MDEYLKAGDGLEAAELLGEIGKADGVVEDPVGAVVVGVWTTNDADDGEVLGVSAGNGVENAQPADGEGDSAGADATRSGVAVRGIAGVELVTASDKAEARFGDEMVEEGEVEVTGDSEDVGDADLDEAAGEVTAEGCFGGADRCGCNGGTGECADVLSGEARRRAIIGDHWGIHFADVILSGFVEPWCNRKGFIYRRMLVRFGSLVHWFTWFGSLILILIFF